MNQTLVHLFGICFKTCTSTRILLIFWQNNKWWTIPLNWAANAYSFTRVSSFSSTSRVLFVWKKAQFLTSIHWNGNTWVRLLTLRWFEFLSIRSYVNKIYVDSTRCLSGLLASWGPFMLTSHCLVARAIYKHNRACVVRLQPKKFFKGDLRQQALLNRVGKTVIFAVKSSGCMLKKSQFNLHEHYSNCISSNNEVTSNREIIMIRSDNTMTSASYYKSCIKLGN